MIHTYLGIYSLYKNALSVPTYSYIINYNLLNILLLDKEEINGKRNNMHQYF